MQWNWYTCSFQFIDKYVWNWLQNFLHDLLSTNAQVNRMRKNTFFGTKFFKGRAGEKQSGWFLEGFLTKTPALLTNVDASFVENV